MLTVIRQAYISRQQSLIFRRDQVKHTYHDNNRRYLDVTRSRKEVYATVGGSQFNKRENHSFALYKEVLAF